MKAPIFIFSLPRSGSTLLQRILMSHPQIASVAEPWLLLPFIYAYRRNGILSEYSHATSFAALEDFISNLPNGKKDYYASLSRFATELYEKHCSNNEIYFLDKTPRYYNIIPEIAQTFPSAKFIFLFRNPVHIMASIINTWCDGRLKCLYGYYRDLYLAPKLLTNGFKLLQNKSFAIQYEKFVTDPKKYTKEVCKYLELDYDETMLINFSQQTTKGKMGDPTGTKAYHAVNSETLEKWKSTFATPYRKKILTSYIETLEEEIFGIQGYNKKEILTDIANMSVKVKYKKCIQDRIDYKFATFVRYVKPNVFFGKQTKSWARHQYLS